MQAAVYCASKACMSARHAFHRTKLKLMVPTSQGLKKLEKQFELQETGQVHMLRQKYVSPVSYWAVKRQPQKTTCKVLHIMSPHHPILLTLFGAPG